MIDTLLEMEGTITLVNLFVVEEFVKVVNTALKPPK
jgi:hypothetical protein